MEIKQFLPLRTIFLMLLFVFLLPIDHAFASSGALRINPQLGNFQTGQTFDVNVTVDGGGDIFNAAEATVVISPSIQVKNITFGDCGFAFVKTPTPANVSFAGVILGGSASSCTVYTVTVQAVSAGVGGITFVNGSIKSYKGAQEILSTTANAAYTLTGTNLPLSPTTPTSPPSIDTSGVKLYTLVVTITPPKNVPLATLKVFLDPNTPGQKVVTAKDQSFAHPVVFTKVVQGVHTIATFSNTTPLNKQIAVVGGTNGTLTLGISTHQTQAPWLWYVVAGIGLLAAGSIGFFFYKKRVHKTLLPTKETPSGETKTM